MQVGQPGAAVKGEAEAVPAAPSGAHDSPEMCPRRGPTSQDSTETVLFAAGLHPSRSGMQSVCTALQNRTGCLACKPKCIGVGGSVHIKFPSPDPPALNPSKGHIFEARHIGLPPPTLFPQHPLNEIQLPLSGIQSLPFRASFESIHGLRQPACLAATQRPLVSHSGISIHLR